MEKLAAVIKRYKVFILLSAVNVFIVILYPETGMKSIEITKSSTLEMLSILPPIFILLGLLDVWVKKETMMKYMGEKSGFIGVLIAFLLGSAAAGPLYAA
ncbi:MAG TPA: permease, partial [Clostridiales bacterium]|nr:permease [Clostridiales bacterium]